MMRANILFATLTFDGHFKPLTSLAKHLQEQGYDVRWYTGNTYQYYLQNLNIPHYPFCKALEVTQSPMDEVFPERKNHKGMMARLKFDSKEGFVRQLPEHVEDIKTIYETFPFDLLIADVGFTALSVVREMFHVPVISVGVMPLSETSQDLPPYGMGLTPEESIFDISIRRSNLFLQIGVPGFEYQRSDLSKNIRFIGALLPYRKRRTLDFTDQEKLHRYKKVILVTQGTAEKDVEKILVPTLEAFKDTNYLVVATTGGSQTRELQDRYPQDNIIIEDFIDFYEIMPYADVFITNGGYGGVMLGIAHKLPMVVAGIHEGKDEINARVGYSQIGINLKTETPTPVQIRESVEEVLTHPGYKNNVRLLAREFQQYDPQKLCEQYVEELLNKDVVQEKKMAVRPSACTILF